MAKSKRSRRKRVEDLTIADVEKAIDCKAKLWEGNCYAIACQIVDAGLVAGRAAYGHYLGPVRGRHWKSRKHLPFQRHGWIVLADGRILDQTRWSFEGRDPYLALIEERDLCSEFDCLDYVCHCGHFDEEHEAAGFFRACNMCECSDFETPGEPDRFRDYDEGGNRLRESRHLPFPPADHSIGKSATLKLPAKTIKYLTSLLGFDWPEGGLLTFGQLHWLGNLPLPWLAPKQCLPARHRSWDHAEAVYAALAKAGYIGLVPIDNRRAVEVKPSCKA